MMEILRLLYTYHQKLTHEVVKNISPILQILAQQSTSQSPKTSANANYLLQRLTKKELVMCDAMSLFSKDRSVRLAASAQLLNYNKDPLEEFQPSRQSKKSLVIDEDYIISYIINSNSQQLSVSVRVSALIQLIESVRRAQISPLVESRLNILNKSLLEELMVLVDSESEEYVLMGWILTLTLQLYIKAFIKINSIPPLNLLLLTLRLYHGSRCKELINSVLGLVYVTCFRNPFSRLP